MSTIYINHPQAFRDRIGKRVKGIGQFELMLPVVPVNYAPDTAQEESAGRQSATTRCATAAIGRQVVLHQCARVHLFVWWTPCSLLPRRRTNVFLPDG